MRVALVSEGTYPFAMGGVSVWCDQLIRGLDDYEWEMVALTVDGEEEQVWDSPDNLVRVRSIELWGPTPTGGRRSGSPGPAFAHAYEEFLATLITPLRQSVEDQSVVRRRFLHALRGLYDYAAGGGNLSHALTSNDALTVMMDAWSEVQTTHLSLADALEAAWLIEHMLRPLAAKPVEADIVHASMNGLSMLVAMASKWRYGTPVVMSEHGIYLRERYLSYVNDNAPHGVKVLILSFFRMLAGAGYLVADALAPHSSYNRRWQLQNGADPERMWTMYNGVPPDDFPKAESEPDEPTIVFMGRIDPLKDLHTLIRAFALVHKEIPDAKLRMFGSTPHGNEVYHESCVDLIEELDLTGIAVLEGRVSTPVHAYHAGSIVALTSISEGFPYTVVEAMACGRSVVATNVGGVAEAVADTGFVVAPRDYKAVAEACINLLANAEMRNELADKAHERVMLRFTLIQSLNAYRAVYEHVIEEDEPAATEPLRIGEQRGEADPDSDSDSEASDSLVRSAAMMPAGEHP